MFTRKTLAFLKALAANNNRDWFDQNRQRYEDEVRTPALEFIEAMANPLAKISPHFVASPKKVGGSLMRVHRDVRFSKDKTPYKTNIGIHFKHERGRDVHAPGFYFHIEPGSMFIGAGIWKPENSTLTAVRTLMDESPKEWQSIVRKLRKTGLDLHGDSLKRPPRGFTDDHVLIEDLKRKDFIATVDLKASLAYDKNLVKETTRLFKAAAPLVKFVCEADDLEF